MHPATAQVSVGTATEFFVESGATVSFDGLVMQPSANLSLNDLTIVTSTTPLSLPVSIARVYTLSSPVGFKGILGIRYDSGELNGLPADKLEIATQAVASGIFTPAVSVAGERYVSAVYGSEITIRQVTAMREGGALPVSLVDFSVREAEQYALLSWQTTAEVNVSHFDVERSVDSRTWQKIGQVAPKGVGVGTADYDFRDQLWLLPQAGRTAIAYYRLKMTDLDGTFSYSGIRSLQWEGSTSVAGVYPNPASDYIRMETATGGLLSVSDMTGRRLVEINAQAGTNDIDVRSLPAGVYFVRINGTTLRWVKQ